LLFSLIKFNHESKSASFKYKKFRKGGPENLYFLPKETVIRNCSPVFGTGQIAPPYLLIISETGPARERTSKGSGLSRADVVCGQESVIQTLEKPAPRNFSQEAIGNTPWVT